ncbi:MAG: CopG family transcriptional regulator [Deltaproteobacteria bacterium]|nr:CopG family transcriptional regulator [Deltaproteobacteria bacterium]
MAKTVTMRLDDAVYKQFLARAKAEHRSLSGFIERATSQYLLESEFVEPEEMHDILADKKLLQRLRQGLKDSSQRKGRFVG